MNNRVNIAIFASGSGSNALNIMRYFKKSDLAKVALVISNNPEAGVLDHADDEQVRSLVLSKDVLYKDSGKVLLILSEYKIDYIVLAGFLLLVPAYLIKAFPDKIVNIHPALLPRFGGKGMYGANVHTAVKKSGATETGITIHLVDEIYDNGRILFQASSPVGPSDTIDDIRMKVQKLEHEHFAPVISEWIKGSHSK